MTGTICGTGSYIPGKCMSNDDIAELVETSDQWIRERTGIRERHIAEGETVAEMAAMAGMRALKNGGITTDQIGLIIVATISADKIMPCAACEVQKKLGAFSALAFDINAACTGFVTAYHTAMAYIETGFTETALIIGSEALSRLVDWKDRGTCILFGDGAGALVLKAKERKKYAGILHSDGTKGFALKCRVRRDETSKSQKDDYITMDGQEVFKFAVKKVPEVIGEILIRNHLECKDISYYILHQANQRIIEAVAKRLGEPLTKFLMNLEKYGNTSSASIPILLDEKNRDKTLKQGQKIIMAGFGAGLSWGAEILEWQ